MRSRFGRRAIKTINTSVAMILKIKKLVGITYSELLWLMLKTAVARDAKPICEKPINAAADPVIVLNGNMARAVAIGNISAIPTKTQTTGIR